MLYFDSSVFADKIHCLTLFPQFHCSMYLFWGVNLVADFHGFFRSSKVKDKEVLASFGVCYYFSILHQCYAGRIVIENDPGFFQVAQGNQV